jgi:hypothetical protein
VKLNAALQPFPVAPEKREMSKWCPETESNRHVLLGTRDFKLAAPRFPPLAQTIINTGQHKHSEQFIGIPKQTLMPTKGHENLSNTTMIAP